MRYLIGRLAALLLYGLLFWLAISTVGIVGLVGLIGSVAVASALLWWAIAGDEPI